MKSQDSTRKPEAWITFSTSELGDAQATCIIGPVMWIAHEVAKRKLNDIQQQSTISWYISSVNMLG